MYDYKPEIVDLDDVPMRKNQSMGIWGLRFLEAPEGKAIMLRYNNRQRAHQVQQIIQGSARYHKVSIKTRLTHAELAIHDTDGWLLYWWKVGKEV